MSIEFVRIADLKRLQFIIKALQEATPSPGHVLDIGCGNGIISAAIARLGYTVRGIDVSEKSIAVARATYQLPNLVFEVVPAGELTAGPQQYDAIICSEVLEHLHDPAALLHTISHSLKDEGILVVTVPNGLGPRELFITRPVQQLQKSNGFAWRFLSSLKTKMGYTGITVQSAADDLTHLQFFTSESLYALAATAGFAIEKIAPSNFIEQVFPFSLLTKKSRFLQRLDCALAERLPLSFTSGFMSIWRKKTAGK